MPKPLNLPPEAHSLVNEALQSPNIDTATVTSLLGGLGLGGARVAEGITAVSEAHPQASAGLEAITNPEQRAALEHAFAASAALYNRIGLAAPTPEICRSAGINLAELAAKWQAEATAGHEPEFILAPRGLSPGRWHKLFQSLQDDPIVNKDEHIKSGGLFISDNITNAWSQLNTVPEAVTAVTASTAGMSASPGNTPQWTLRIIPGTNRPPTANVDYYGRTSNDQPKQPLQHPTISEYLTLQAQRLAAQQPPIDEIAYSWLNGTFAQGSQAPCGDWDPDDGQVRLYWCDPGGRYAGLGVRLPVW